MDCYVALDIGASSGRIILFDKNKEFKIKEIHRFSNGFRKKDGNLRWDIEKIIKETLKGLEKVKELGIEECSFGVDTWAVDYILLDKHGNVQQDPISYRDSRAKLTIKKMSNILQKRKIYEKTGIQFLEFNTIYQLFEEDRDLINSTYKILLIPDYINYFLTGKVYGEVTNWSTSQLLNVNSRDFDNELLDILNIKRSKFPELIEPGSVIGKIREELFDIYDLPEIEVVAVASHDTASAIVGIPAINRNWTYISSGTWSLVGVELDYPIINENTFRKNITNEWGAYNSYRFLKNIVGMWIIQKISKEIKGKYSYEFLQELASKEKPFKFYIDLTDDRFINPPNMTVEILKYLDETGQESPQNIGQLIMGVYSNLSLIYALQVLKLEEIIKKRIEIIHIVGGGSSVSIINQLTANLSRKEVVAGPKEATAYGNLIIQMISNGDFKNLNTARNWLYKNMDLEKYHPRDLEFDYYLEEYKDFLNKSKENRNG